MPDQPEDEGTVETHSGQLGQAEHQSPARMAAVANAPTVSKELLDERQRQMGERRKPAGPPHVEAAVAQPADTEPEDVPATDCDESQSE